MQTKIKCKNNTSLINIELVCKILIYNKMKQMIIYLMKLYNNIVDVYIRVNLTGKYDIFYQQ